MAGMLDLSQLSPDQLSQYGMLFAGSPEAMGAQLSPDDADVLAQQRQDAATRLAQRMRQQSPNVPPADPNAAPLASRFGSFAPPDGSTAMPLPPPQVVKTAPQPVNVAPAAPAPSVAGPSVDDAALPQSAAPTQGVPASAPPASAPSLLERVGQGLNNNSNLLLALGAGFAGAPSLGTGMQRAFTNAQAPAAQNQTVQALVARGMPDDMARMVASNPQALNQVLPRFLGAKQWQLGESSDLFGQKKPFLYDPVSGDTKMLDFSGAGASGGAPGGAQTMANFNMAGIDPNLKGEDYLKQWPQEVQAAARSFMAGDVMPTGNPRNNNISSIAKTVAQKYAMDIGRPGLADDSLFSERRKMRTDLGASSPNSMGGILSNGKSAFEHLASASDRLVDLGNANGPNIPAGGHLATIANVAGNVIAPTSETQGKITAASDNLLKYGQESTKFYAGTGGGEGERMAALKALNPQTSSGNEQAGFLQTEKELMTARLQQKEQQIRDTLGQGYLDQHPVVTPDLKATLAKIDANIAKLRGQAPAPAANSGQSAAAAPNAVLVRQNGHLYQRQPDGSMRAIQ